VLKELWVLKEQ